MAVASASLAVSIAAVSGPIVFCWRPHNMKALRSPLSPIQMIVALETIQSLLENYPCSLSGYEKSCLTKFATSVAESMESNPAALITILPYSVSPGVSMGSQERRRLFAAQNALKYLTPGDWARYCSGPWNPTPPPTSLDTWQKSIHALTTPEEDTRLSHECPSDPE